MQNTYDILIKNRQYLLQLIEPYSFEQLNSVPKTFSNSIIWNFGHLMVTEKTLTYGLSNLEIPIVTAQEIEMFRKGTFPITYQKELWDKIRSNFILSLNRTLMDFQKGVFQGYTPYTTSIGVNLSDLETTAQYILYHEGIHAGVIQSIRKQF